MHKNICFLPEQLQGNLVWLFAALVCLQACGGSESTGQVNLLGSYLRIEEMNMNAGMQNQVHIQCKGARNKPLSDVLVNVLIEKPNGSSALLTQDWKLTDRQGQQQLPFTLTEEGVYTLTLQIKPQGSELIFQSQQAYSAVKVFSESITAGIPRGKGLNTQLLLLNEVEDSLKGQASVITFSSSDPLALLPAPIQIERQDVISKIIIQGSRLFTLGKQTIWAINSFDNRIVSEQTYQVLPEQKSGYIGQLVIIDDFVVANGKDGAAIDFTLTTDEGDPVLFLPVVLKIGTQGQEGSLQAQTDGEGRARFTVTSTTAGKKLVELWMQSVKGFVPLTSSQVTFLSGGLAGLRFLTNPTIGIAGELLEPAPILQAVDAWGNPLQVKGIPVTLQLSQRQSNDPNAEQAIAAGLVGSTTGWLEDGFVTFDNVAVFRAGAFYRLQAIAPGIEPQYGGFFSIDPAPAQQLAFVQEPKQGIAWGKANVVQVGVQDAFGNGIALDGLLVDFTLRAGASPATLLNPSSLATSLGLVLFNSAVSTSGSGFVLEARAANLATAVSRPFDVNAGDPNRQETSLTLLTTNPVVANGQNPFRFRITALDAQRKPVIGFVVQVKSSSLQDGFTPLPAVTDANGQVEINMTSTLAGEKLVSVECGAFNFIIEPAPVFVAGPIKSAGLRLEQTSQVADGVAGLLVKGQLQDDFGNSLANVAYALTSTIATDVLTPALGSSDSQGKFQAIVRATQAGVRSIQLQAGAYQSGLLPATFVAGPPSLLTSFLNVTPSSAVTDGQSPAILQANIADAFGNPAAHAEVLFQVSGLGNSITNALSYTNSNGQASAELRSRMSQDKAIQAKLKSLTLTAQVTFLPKPCEGNPKLSFEENVLTYAIGSRPFRIVRGDFNRDSIDDLAVANYSEANIGVLLSKPDGIFANQVTYPSCGVVDLIATDINNDGYPDLVSACPSSRSLNVHINQLDGSFVAQNSYPTAGDIWGLVALDINRDGLNDIAVTNRGTNNLQVFIGQPNHTLVAQSTYVTGGAPSGLVAFDANRDGVLDLAVVNYSGHTLGVFIANANGTFAAQVTYPTNFWPINLTKIDANRDGVTDLVVLSYVGNMLDVFIGKPDGSFFDKVFYPLDRSPSDLVAVDVNRDGLTDLAVVNYGGNTFGFLLGQSNGTFVIQNNYPVKGYPTAIVDIDANRDGIADLAVASEQSNTLEIFIGQSDGTFTTKPTYRTGVSPQNLTAVDMNRDGLTDFVVANGLSDSIGLLLGQANNTFAEQVIFPTGGYSNPRGLAALDLNRDGLMDLAVARSTRSNIGVFLGRSDGGLMPQVTYASGVGPVAVVPLDVNRDTIPDLAIANTDSNSISVFVGRGDGTLTAQVTYPTGNNPSSLTPIDVNRDGIVDLAVLNTISNTLGIFIGRSNSTFFPQVAYATGGYPVALTSLDINGDGIQDLAVINLLDNTLSLLIGQANGVFAAQVTYPTGISPSSLVTLDANQDGVPDLAVANAGSNTVGLFLGQVNGTLEEQVTYAAGSYPNGLKVLDINQDGVSDLLVNGIQTSLLLGAPNGTFGAALRYDQPSTEVYVTDLNRNYIPDIVLLSNSGLQVIERLSCGP